MHTPVVITPLPANIVAVYDVAVAIAGSEVWDLLAGLGHRAGW
jgi:hypothetical protein